MSLAYRSDLDCDDGTEVVELTLDEFEIVKQRALEALGLTYAQLKQQARRRNFSSPQAHMLWVAIGEQDR